MLRANIILYFEPKKDANESAIQQWREQIKQNVPTFNWVRRVKANDNQDDSQPYREQFLIDIEDYNALTENDVNSIRLAGANTILHSDWHIYREISRDLRDGVGSNDYPATGTDLIQVGMAPKPDAVQDYHDWFDKEHLQMLADIPGWRSGSRYEWVASYGDGREIAWPFMSANEYEPGNGLGGPIWQKSMDTPWTVRVLDNLTKPNHRRAWKYVPV